MSFATSVTTSALADPSGDALSDPLSSLQPSSRERVRRASEAGAFQFGDIGVGRRIPAGNGKPAGAPVEHDFSRRMVLPESDRAYWRAPASSDSLQYLAWGARKYEDSPTAESRHEGWSYVVVEAGAPTLLHDGRRDRIDAPAMILIGPDCSYGWQSDSLRTSKLLMWMWRRPVHAALARLQSDAVVRLNLGAGELAELRHLHALTRNEIYSGDLHSSAALDGLQVLLEARIARISDGAGDPRKQTVDRALNWIEAHLTTRQPLARLADFLGVSPATVQRLFRERLGTTVMKCIAEIRRREAERMLKGKGVTIKEVAYRLGYRHPHDFSRAFRNYTGRLPSRRATVVGAETAGAAR